MLRSQTIACVTSGWLIVMFASSVAAQLPATRLQGVFPSGGRPGETLEIELVGADLDEVVELAFDVPGITAQPVMTTPDAFYPEPRRVDGKFTLTIDGGVPAGTYDVRCRGLYGWSNPARFIVSPLTGVIEQDENNEISKSQLVTLPVLFHGRTRGGADVDWVSFHAKAGERVSVEGISASIDSPVQLVMSLHDDQGREIASQFEGVQGDPCLDYTVPREGDYFLKVHDRTFVDGIDRCYALRIGSFPVLVSAFPPMIEAGKSAPITLYGFQLPGSRPSSFKINGRALEELVVDVPMNLDLSAAPVFSGRVESHQAWASSIEHRLNVGGMLTTPVRIAAAQSPVIAEVDGNDAPLSAQSLAWPCEVAGRWYPQADVDWYSFEAKAGEILAIDLMSHRLGLPTDAAMLVQRVSKAEDGTEKVEDVVFMDDVPAVNNAFQRGQHEFDVRSNDPTYVLTVPQDGTYRVMVRDSLSSVRSDVRAAYRLAIRKPAHDFRLVAVPGESFGSWFLRKGGREYLRVWALRQEGFDGEIRVKVEGLADGIVADEIVIGPGNHTGTLVLSCGDQVGPVVCRPQVVGRASIANAEVVRRAAFGAASRTFQIDQPTNNVASVPARLTSPPMLCVSAAEIAPATITIEGTPLIEASRGSVLKIPYKVRRKEGIGGSLLGFPMNLPANSQGAQVTMGADAGEFEIRFQATSPPGTYSFYLAGFFQNMQYQRNPEAVVVAEADAKRITDVLTAAQQAQRDAATAAQQAAQALTAAESELTAAKTADQQAQTMLAAAMKTLEEATAAMEAARKASEAAPEDADAKAKLAAAMTARDQAATKLAEVEKVRTEAALKLEMSTTKRDEATRTKEEKDRLSQEAIAFATLAQQTKQQADQKLQATRQASNPRNVSDQVPSNTLTVVVKESPIEMAVATSPVVMVAGADKVPLTVNVQRFFGFTGAITLQVVKPNELGGVAVANVNVAEGQTQGILEFMANANTPVGVHQVTLRGQINFNGQNLVIDRPFEVKVDPAPPATTQ